MNIFRLLGDLSHVIAILILLLKIWKTRSCTGISGRSQILLLIVFTSRYLDVFSSYISFYNIAMKILFLITSYGTVYLIFFQFNTTYDSNHDTFKIEFLILPCAVLAFLINHSFEPIEILWTLSIYLESVAMVPQLWMVYKMGQVPKYVILYLMALGSYRALYLVNWIYRYYVENYLDTLAIGGGVLQTLSYLFFFVWYFLTATERSTTIYTLDITQPHPEDILVGKDPVGKNPVEEAVTLPTKVYSYVIDEPEDILVGKNPVGKNSVEEAATWPTKVYAYVIDEPEDSYYPTKGNSADPKLNHI